MGSGGSRSGVWIGVGVGCLLVLCCGGTIGGWFVYQGAHRMDTAAVGVEQQALEAVEPVALADVAWGEIQLAADPTHVYASASTSAEVLETREQGTRVDYYGLDTSGSFFKVKTADGGEGFVSSGDAELEAYQGQLRIVADRAVIYETASAEGTALELHNQGDQVDWYGYDSSGQYYKVHTGSGADGYLRVVDAEIPY